MRNSTFGFIATMLIITLLSCNRGEVFHQFHHISHGQWQRGEAVVFNMDSLNFRPDAVYQVIIALSANNTFPYRNLQLLVEHNLTDTIFTVDTLQLALVDEFGRRLGAGMGGLRQLSIPLLTDRTLDTARVYQINIAHNMRTRSLRGVERVGVIVVEQ